ncbi:MAG: ABC transporter permease [Tannerella sp.]|jgi:putative ABC transport system permease protein|nr:ABC transporter permease [Tannerella sp.]
MKTIIIAFRSLFRKDRNSVTKIASLSAGLAVGLALIAKVYFEQTYDNFFPDAGRIYQIRSNFKTGDMDAMQEFPQVSGAIAPGLKMELPEVEVATRFTYIAYDETFLTDDGKKYKAERIALADTCLFDIFPLPVLAGDPKDVLARPLYVMIDRRTAERLGGITAAVGQTIVMTSYPGKRLTVGGVFETLPLNSHLNYSMLLSMVSIGQFTHDGTMNWLGNDRYQGYVRLMPGTDAAALAPAIRRMQVKHQDIERIEAQAGIELRYSLFPLLDVHNGTEGARRMTSLLAILAFALLFTAVMNYVLIVISSLVGRTKEMAVSKCYGASGWNIHARMLAETLAALTVSLAVSAALLYACRGTVEDLLGAGLATLFNWRSLAILGGVCAVVFAVSGLVPGALFARVPVAAAFRNYTENRRVWKLALLFVQIVAAGFLLSLLTVIAGQYGHMVNNNPGYTYSNLACVSMGGTDAESAAAAAEELRRLPEVEAVTSATNTLLGGASGNNITLPGEDRELFNASDLYYVGNGYFDIMQIPLIEGRTFMENVSSSSEIMVSRTFAEKLEMTAGWTDGVLGKGILVTEHSGENRDVFTICGVYEDVRVGAIRSEEVRPTMLFYRNTYNRNMVIKYHHLTPEAVQRTQATLEALYPDRDVVVRSYATEITGMYDDTRRFRDSVLIGSIVTLIIVLLGLTGYTRDEVNRRRKEVAIRRISGATLTDILRLFVGDVSRIALPAIVLGGGAAAYVATNWQAQFAEKTGLTAALFVACAAVVMAVIVASVVMSSYRAANENPARNIKSE